MEKLSPCSNKVAWMELTESGEIRPTLFLDFIQETDYGLSLEKHFPLFEQGSLDGACGIRGNKAYAIPGFLRAYHPS